MAVVRYTSAPGNFTEEDMANAMAPMFYGYLVHDFKELETLAKPGHVVATGHKVKITIEFEEK